MNATSILSWLAVNVESDHVRFNEEGSLSAPGITVISIDFSFILASEEGISTFLLNIIVTKPV